MMRNRVARSAVAGLLAGIAMVFGTTSHGQSPQGGASGTLQVTATATADLRNWDTYVTQGRRSGALQIRATTRDPLVPGHTTERFQQFYQGVPIWGSEVVRDSADGITTAIFGVLSPDNLALSVRPALSTDQGRVSLASTGGIGASLLTEPALVIVRLPTGEHHLTYSAVVSGNGKIDRVFIDGQTGTEVMRYSEIQTQTQAVGTGVGVLGDQKKLSVQSASGTFFAYDTHRPPVIQTFDLRNSFSAFKGVLAGVRQLSGSDTASDSDNVWTDPAVVDAHVHVSWAYDFIFKRFGRSGLDGRDKSIYVVTNALSKSGALSVSSDDFFDYAVNAFWCGSCASGAGFMFFGNGFPDGYYQGATGQSVTNVAGSLDVAVHELAHAVIDSSSDLVYRNESGALNEAFSDMIGTAAEFYFHPGGTGVRTADYLLGEDSWRAYLTGSKSGIRSMENPGLYGDPDHYSRRYIGSSDNGGVHSNSGIPNNAFYLAIEGGVNRTSGLAVQGVGSSNREQIEKTFFRAFTLLMPANATFSVARAATIQAARDLYGANSAAERAVTQAWTAVGVN